MRRPPAPLTACRSKTRPASPSSWPWAVPRSPATARPGPVGLEPDPWRAGISGAVQRAARPPGRLPRQLGRQRRHLPDVVDAVLAGRFSARSAGQRGPLRCPARDRLPRGPRRLGAGRLRDPPHPRVRYLRHGWAVQWPGLAHRRRPAWPPAVGGTDRPGRRADDHPPPRPADPEPLPNRAAWPAASPMSRRATTIISPRTAATPITHAGTASGAGSPATRPAAAMTWPPGSARRRPVTWSPPCSRSRPAWAPGWQTARMTGPDRKQSSSDISRPADEALLWKTRRAPGVRHPAPARPHRHQPPGAGQARGQRRARLLRRDLRPPARRADALAGAGRGAQRRHVGDPRGVARPDHRPVPPGLGGTRTPRSTRCRSTPSATSPGGPRTAMR